LYLEKAIHGLFPKGCLKKKPRFFLWHCRHIVWRGQLFLEKAIHGNGVRHRCYVVFEVLKNCETPRPQARGERGLAHGLRLLIFR